MAQAPVPSPSENPSGNFVTAGRTQRVFLLIACAWTVYLCALRAWVCWPNDSALDHVSGIWTALAVDLSHGIFYRAPFGPAGYGGTRYFPLFFSLHAGLIRLFGDWRLTGYAIAVASVILLIAGLYVLLRRLGADRMLAAGGALAVLAGFSTQQALLGIREDGFATMLNIWGVALCARQELRRRDIGGAVVLFTLAFVAKETTVFGVAAVVLAFVLARRYREAWLTGVLTAFGYVFILGAIYFGSHGRIVEIFRMTVSGGASHSQLLEGPWVFIDTINENRPELVLVMLAVAALFLTPLRKLASIPNILFGATAVVTCAIYATPGTTANHLIDLAVAAIVVIIAWGAQDQRRAQLSAAVLAAALFMVSYATWDKHGSEDFTSNHDQLREVAAAARATGGTVLTEDPTVAIMAGQQPYVLDPFMFRVIRERHAGFEEPLWRKLRNHEFSAVVLMNDPEPDEGRKWYDETHFGKGFIEELNKHYRRAGTPGDRYLYVPR